MLIFGTETELIDAAMAFAAKGWHDASDRVWEAILAARTNQPRSIGHAKPGTVYAVVDEGGDKEPGLRARCEVTRDD